METENIFSKMKEEIRKSLPFTGPSGGWESPPGKSTNNTTEVEGEG